MAEFRAVIAAWTVDYNTERPHTSLAGRAPAAFARDHKRQRARQPRPASPELRRGSAQRALTTVHHPESKAKGSLD
jgi:putative transposase